VIGHRGFYSRGNVQLVLSIAQSPGCAGSRYRRPPAPSFTFDRHRTSAGFVAAVVTSSLKAELGALQNGRESRRDSETSGFAESERYD
jgi:hypothetical protein